MNYIKLGPDVFYGERGRFSLDTISHYCQHIAKDKFMYDGSIDGYYLDELIFPNIIKCGAIYTKNVVRQFPDLEEVENMFFVINSCWDMLDIGNIKYAAEATITTFNIPINKRVHYINKNIKVIDKNTLVINGKELKTNNWKIGEITIHNYKQFGL